MGAGPATRAAAVAAPHPSDEGRFLMAIPSTPTMSVPESRTWRRPGDEHRRDQGAGRGHVRRRSPTEHSDRSLTPRRSVRNGIVRGADGGGYSAAARGDRTCPEPGCRLRLRQRSPAVSQSCGGGADGFDRRWRGRGAQAPEFVTDVGVVQAPEMEAALPARGRWEGRSDGGGQYAAGSQK
ncbi:conserved hypothetical protein (plasmid) [Rhodococcus jostii RHA1]|uniref:Uncharacterized protein n=1 Tax=Rhodococcus jostii (strain RHA1) TaxID=101510 RepID=Q0RZK3_RHOJR|nr:conserved hypothetical protein [Rhodococcus jostii RHA1]